MSAATEPTSSAEVIRLTRLCSDVVSDIRKKALLLDAEGSQQKDLSLLQDLSELEDRIQLLVDVEHLAEEVAYLLVHVRDIAWREADADPASRPTTDRPD